MDKQPQSRLRERLIIGLGILVVLLVLAETAIGFFYPHGFMQRVYDQQGNTHIMVVETNPNHYALIRYDPIVGWENSKNTKGVLTTVRGEYTINITQDELGNRNSDYFDTIEPGKTIFLGDSFTWGMGTEYENTIPAIYQNKTGKKSYNLGVPGYGTDQEYAVLLTKIEKYKPTEIILNFNTATDFSDNYLKDKTACVPKQHIALDNGTLIRISNPQRCSDKAFDPIENIEKFNLGFLLNSKIFDGTIYVSERLFRMVSKGAENAIYLEVYEKNQTKESIEAYDLTEALLAKMNEIAKRNNATFVVSIVPDKMEVGGGAYASLDKGKYDLDLPTRKLMEMGKKHGFTVLDPLSEYRINRNGANLFYIYDGHLNNEGYRIYSENLVKLEGMRP